MGNNASKERKPDSETAEWENQHHVPSLYRSSSKKRKTIDEVRFIDESKNTLNIAEEENRNNMELAPTQTDLSAVIGHNDCVRDRKELHTLSNVICDQGTVESGKEQSGVRRKKKKHYSTSHVNKTKTETNKVLSVDKKQNDQQLIGKMNGIDQQLIASKMNGIDQQLIASKMNGIVQDISSDFATHPPISAFSAIQAPAFSAIKAPVFSAIQASEFINSTDQTHNAEMEDGNSTGTHIAWACYDDAEASTKSTPLVATASAGLTKSTENDCKSKSELRTKSSSGLPEPSLMQHVSTVGSVSATGSSSTPSLFSTNFSVQSSLQTSYPVLVSNVGSVASSNSSLFRSPVFTQSQPTATASAFGNFPYSGNVLPYVTTSSISPSTTNSSSLLPNRFSYGNFSMSSGASTTGRNSPGVTPSNSHLDALQPNRHSFNMYASQTNVSVGSSSNSLSVFTTNNSTSQTSFDGSPYTTSHTSLTVDTNVSDSLSYMTNDNLRNSPDGIVRNRDVLEYEVEEDAMDHLYADGFAFQTDMSSHNESRNTNNFDRDYIFIRTSVGDTITQISAKNITLNTNYVDNDLTDENMGIILERPKYPRYATLASREKSFENLWPPSNKMCWVKLPEAGFVYTGTADCVRCYYCNGGLREWLKNDCPWTEHARYYPHCPHVRQNKGDEFVRRVRDGTDDGAVDQDGGSGDEMDVDNGAENTSLSRDQEAINIAAEIISDRTLLEKAAYYIKNVQEKSSFDAQQLAAIAFEIEDGAILFNFEDAFEDDRSSIFDAVLTESESSENEDELEVDGCVLEEENRMLRDRSLCKVCLDATACVLFLECGHMIACAMCAPALKTCAVCRAEVKGTVRAIYATDR